MSHNYGNKRQEVVGSYDCSHPEKTWHIKLSINNKKLTVKVQINMNI